MVPDSGLNRAIFVALTGPTTVITSFNLTTRVQIDSITIPNVSGFLAVHLVGWGQNSLAFETDQNQLVLVGGSLVHSFFAAAFNWFYARPLLRASFRASMAAPRAPAVSPFGIT
jgi:hypothetical protein